MEFNLIAQTLFVPGSSWAFRVLWGRPLWQDCKFSSAAAGFLGVQVSFLTNSF